MVHVIARNIEGGESINVIVDDDIHLQGKVDGNSSITLTSLTGTITIDGKIDGSSSANIRARGNIRIGATGSAGDRKVDGGSSVTATSERGSIWLDGKIDGRSIVTFSARNDIRIGAFGGAGDRKIDNNSEVTLTSLRGSVLIDGKIDENCKVEIIVAGNVEIGRFGDAGDRKIDNNCDISIRAGGQIVIGDKIDHDCVVDMRACGDIKIGNKIDGNARVRLATQRGTITVADKIDGGAHVRYWPSNALNAIGGIRRARVEPMNWAGIDYRCLSGDTITGSLIRDWGWTFGFVTGSRLIPRSLEELVIMVRNTNASQKIKARGGGWSFGDAVLPFDTQDEVNRVSILKRGEGEAYDFRRVLEGLGEHRRRAVDLQPNLTQRSYHAGKNYNQAQLREDVQSSMDLPSADNRFKIIDTRELASSLQTQFQNILNNDARTRIQTGKHYFWVEAGISITNLNTVLDHQKPRLAIQASGGSPGATLAGTLATATHGGEFRWPLLVDMVRAIHLVGPGGEEWWIEGDESIAELRALQRIYPNIDTEHFIAGDWRGPHNLTPSDVLNSTTVSLGALGVVYSMVIEVVEQYGLEQRTVSINSWSQLLTLADTTENQLRRGDIDANNRMLNVLLDGRINGSGISLEDNVYVDLAINPINRACWVVNRRTTPSLPEDVNPLPVDIDTYLSSAEQVLGRNAEAASTYHIPRIQSSMVRRLHDFLHYGTSDGDIHNNISQLLRLLSFITRRTPVLATALATVNVQAVLNAELRRADSRGRQFLADLLDTVLHALQGTGQGQVSTTTGVSYKIGAIGWPNDGIPGRGIEIGLHQDVAFSFLQKTIFDRILDREISRNNKPLLGYISIRVCPQTKTFMGMQQFGPQSVMVELVGFRTPEANYIMDEVQRETLRLNQDEGLKASLHWGLENDQLDSKDMQHSPYDQAYLRSSPRLSQLMAFLIVKGMLLKTHPPVFDNNLVQRLFSNFHPLNASLRQRSADQLVVEVRTRVPVVTGFDSSTYDHALVMLVEQDGARDSWEIHSRVEIVDGTPLSVIDYHNASYPGGVNTSGPEDDVGGAGARRRLRLVNLRRESGVAIEIFNFMRDQPDPDPDLEFYAIVTAVSVQNRRAVAQYGGILFTETIKIRI